MYDLRTEVIQKIQIQPIHFHLVKHCNTNFVGFFFPLSLILVLSISILCPRSRANNERDILLCANSHDYDFFK
jgi:hypothetical protein